MMKYFLNQKVAGGSTSSQLFAGFSGGGRVTVKVPGLIFFSLMIGRTALARNNRVQAIAKRP